MLKTISKLVDASQIRTPITLPGDVTLSTGNLVFGTAGKGIDFSSDPSAPGMTSELLDDYEEGTWTPAVSGSGTAGTYELASTNGTYTKIGKQVTLIGYVQLAAVVTGGGTGALTITGLPYSKAGSHYPVGAVLLSGVTFTSGASLTSTFGTVSPGSVLYFEETKAASSSGAVQVSGVGAGNYIFFEISYWV